MSMCGRNRLHYLCHGVKMRTAQKRRMANEDAPDQSLENRASFVSRDFRRFLCARFCKFRTYNLRTILLRRNSQTFQRLFNFCCLKLIGTMFVSNKQPWRRAQGGAETPGSPCLAVRTVTKLTAKQARGLWNADTGQPSALAQAIIHLTCACAGGSRFESWSMH